MSCINCKKKKTNMKTMIAKLSDNEILFCEKWIEVLKNRRNIKTEDVDYCYKLIYKQGVTNHCPQCLRDYAANLNNYYKTIMNKYSDYKNEQTKLKEAELKEKNGHTEKVEPKVVEKKVVKTAQAELKKVPVKKVPPKRKSRAKKEIISKVKNG